MSSTKVTTPAFRASYLHVFEPSETPSGDMKYSVSMIFPKSTDIELLRAAVKQAGVNKWGADNSKWPKNLNKAIRDGDVDRSNSPEYGDSFFISAKSNNQPGIVDENVQKIIDPTLLFSGCWCRASVSFYAYDRAGNKGIACGLNNIMKIKEDERLDGRRSAEEDFSQFASGDGFVDDILF